LPRVRERFGKGHVTLGEPIELGQLLDSFDADWRTRSVDDYVRMPWVNAAVDELAQRIMRNINAAAVVTPVNLLAVTLLATPRQTLPEADLLRQLDLYKALLAAFPYSAHVTTPRMSSAQMIAYGEALQMLTRHSHALGD